ncbi:hypothetical protein [Corynebacterium glutamicum]|uniref:hypothetical protein n=1 Tax=Corynebacterium glutamicum TaxID=1718 RepID=UPI001468DC0A|nr:hypothetical protein [Corynebacterium glutamicum]GFK17742.1 hypothetical protein KbCgl_03140 [Corynebacterium glutamicum]
MGALSTIATRGISILASFLLTVTVSRILGAEQAGVFFLIFTLNAFLATAGRFGADNLALRLLSGDSESPKGDVLRLGQVVVGVSLLVALISLVPLVHYFNETIPWTTVVLAASSIVPQAIAVFAGAVMRGLKWMAGGVFSELGSLPTLLVFLIVINDLVGLYDNDLNFVLGAMALAAWVTAGWATLAVLRVLRRLSDSGLALSFPLFLKQHGGKMMPMAGTSLLAYGMVWAPVFILSALSAMEEVSYYSVAARMANFLILIPSIQISYLAPQFARLFYAHETSKLNLLTAQSVRQVLALTVVPILLLLFLADPIIQLVFGPSFGPAASVMRLLIVGITITISMGQVNQLMLLCGLERLSLLLTTCAVGVWVIAGWWVAQFFGALGAATLGVIISSSYAVTSALRLKARTGIKSYFRGFSLEEK